MSRCHCPRLVGMVGMDGSVWWSSALLCVWAGGCVCCLACFWIGTSYGDCCCPGHPSGQSWSVGSTHERRREALSPSHCPQGSSELSHTPEAIGINPHPLIPLLAPQVLPTSFNKGGVPPRLPRLPTCDGAWDWDQPLFSTLCSTPTSAQSCLGNQPANDASCGADGGPDAILPSSGLSMQIDV